MKNDTEKSSQCYWGQSHQTDKTTASQAVTTVIVIVLIPHRLICPLLGLYYHYLISNKDTLTSWISPLKPEAYFVVMIHVESYVFLKIILLFNDGILI